MPVGAFYSQDGGELARRVSDHARKVRFMVKRQNGAVRYLGTKPLNVNFCYSC